MISGLDRKVIIVEGVTNSGKTTFIKQLRKQIPGSTQIKFSDYYQKQMHRFRGSIDLNFDTKNLASVDVAKLIGANNERYVRLLNLAKSTVDDFIIERLHITDIVYQRAVFGSTVPYRFREVEDKMNKMGAYLVMLTIPDNVLETRCVQTLPGRNRRNGASFEIPSHLLNPDNNRRKNEHYLEALEKSRVERKIIIDTSIMSPEECISCLGNLVS